MLQAFYTATVGAQQQMERMGVQGNNMANANTFGFRAEKPAFEALMYRMVDGIDGQQLPKGSGTRMVSTITDFRSVAMEETGRKQDYAIVGDGFFALYDPDTGEISYTRDGSFALSSFQQIKETEQRIHFTIWRMERAGRFWTPTGYPIVVTDAEAAPACGRVYHSIPGRPSACGQRPVCDHGEKRCGVDEPLGGAPGLSGELQCGLGF